jgi:hypothetical protein
MKTRALASSATVVALLMWATPPAQAITPSCGDTITQSVVLTSDLACPGTAFSVSSTPAVSQIVVNFNGHTVSSLSSPTVNLRPANRSTAVTLENGRIVGNTHSESGAITSNNMVHDTGVLVAGINTSLTVLNSEFINGAGIFLSESSGDVRNSQFSGSGATGAAIFLSANSAATVTDSSINGYDLGIDVSWGEINAMRNTISGNRIGMEVGLGGGALTDNQVTGNSGDGILMRNGAGWLLPNRDLSVRGNALRFNGGDGIHIIAPAPTDSSLGIAVTLTNNLAVENTNFGIESPGTIPPHITVTDGGGNVAYLNQGPAQCLNVVCQAPPPPPPPPSDTTGPVTVGTVATPNPVITGQAVHLGALISDQATGNSAVVSGSYRIGAGPPVAMAATNGAFGEPIEGVSATVPALATPGVYSLCVHGTDGLGNVGPEACLDLAVTSNPPPPLVLGETLFRPGYWMASADGRVFPFGAGIALALGQPAGSLGSNSVVEIEGTPSGNGYWVIDNGGHVYAYGDAPWLGGVSQLPAGERVTSISSTPSGQGYWIFTSAGRVLPFGAPFFGDLAGVHLNGPVLDSVATPSGLGYYMVATDGGVFTFGDAKFQGSMGATKLNAPVRSLVPDPDGTGYWLVASDGGVFAFSAPFKGSMGSIRLNQPITGMVPFGDAYLMVAADGGIFNFAALPFAGSLGATPPSSPIVSVAVVNG